MMNKDRFVEIVMSEGFNKGFAEDLWDTSPYDHSNPILDDELRIRRTCRSFSPEQKKEMNSAFETR